MRHPKPRISILKGTDDILGFRRQGPGGIHLGNTNLDHRIDRDIFDVSGLFVNPLAFNHIDKLLAQTDGLLFNAITDPDINPICLAHLNRALKTSPRTIINHPRLVMQTRRHDIAQALAGMDGLIVPRAIRVDSQRPQELLSAITSARMRYPLLMRSISAHNQQHLLKVDDPSQLRMTEKLPGKSRYLTEFHDYRSADGLYRNYRFFIFATGAIVARNIDIGTDWKVGVHVRDTFMAHRDDLLREVLDYVENYETIVGKSRLKLLQDIRARLGLDYIGMDCNLLPTGELLLFETNVVMNADADPTPDGKFLHFAITKAAITHAMTELLHSRMELPAGTGM